MALSMQDLVVHMYVKLPLHACSDLTWSICQASRQSLCIMMQDIAAPLYAQLLADAAQRLGPSPAFYSLWPVSEPSAPWATVAAKLFKEVSSSCLHTF